MLTQKKLHELLTYDPNHGVFYWNTSAGCQKKLAEAGCVNQYLYIKIEGKRYPAHRLAFLYQLGDSFPHYDIDHKNGVKTDNRWLNLRLATRKQNTGNAKLREDNALGHKNIKQLFDTKKYQVRVCGKSYGCYSTLADAMTVADIARKEVFGEYARSS